MPRDEGFELFDDEQDVEVRTPTIAKVLLTLVGAGIVAAIVVIVLANVVTFGRPDPETLCDGAASCSDLTVEQVSSLTALELPANADVVSSSYDSTSERILIEATVELPVGSANPFDGSSYFEVDESELDLAANLTPVAFYAATGELGALVADGVLADDGFSELVIVRVVRSL